MWLAFGKVCGDGQVSILGSAMWLIDVYGEDVALCDGGVGLE